MLITTTAISNNHVVEQIMSLIKTHVNVDKQDSKLLTIMLAPLIEMFITLQLDTSKKKEKITEIVILTDQFVDQTMLLTTMLVNVNKLIKESYITNLVFLLIDIITNLSNLICNNQLLLITDITMLIIQIILISMDSETIVDHTVEVTID